MITKSQKNKKQPRKGLLERRDRILEAAIEVFAEKGIKGATIDEIAVRAGVGKGTIYRRVGKKEDFVNILLQRAAKLVSENIKLEIKKRTDPLLQFKEAIYALCDVYDKNLSLIILAMSQMAIIKQSNAKKSNIAKKEILKVFQQLENILKKAIKRGQIRPVDTHIIIKGLLGFLNPHTYQYLRFKRDYTKGEIAQLTIDLFLDGLKVKKK